MAEDVPTLLLRIAVTFSEVIFNEEIITVFYHDMEQYNIDPPSNPMDSVYNL